MMNYLVLDVGGTYIKYATANEKMELRNEGKVKTPKENQRIFFQKIEEIFHSCEENIQGVALSLPGTINPNTGLVIQGGSLTFNENQYLGKQLEEILHVPVSIHNDAKCAAMAELTHGNMQDISDGLVLVFGTGVGGCFIKNHEIHEGHHFFAGEVSAMITRDPLIFGKDAALGKQMGIPGFVGKVKEIKKWKDDLDGQIIFEWIKQGDQMSLKLLQEHCWNIAIQLYNLQCMFDPQRICLGGAISSQPLFLEMIQTMMDQLYQQLPKFIPRAELMTCKFYNDSNLIGALCYHLLDQERA